MNVSVANNNNNTCGTSNSHWLLVTKLKFNSKKHPGRPRSVFTTKLWRLNTIQEEAPEVEDKGRAVATREASTANDDGSRANHWSHVTKRKFNPDEHPGRPRPALAKGTTGVWTLDTIDEDPETEEKQLLTDAEEEMVRRLRSSSFLQPPGLFFYSRETMIFPQTAAMAPPCPVLPAVGHVDATTNKLSKGDCRTVDRRQESSSRKAVVSSDTSLPKDAVRVSKKKRRHCRSDKHHGDGMADPSRSSKKARRCCTKQQQVVSKRARDSSSLDQFHPFHVTQRVVYQDKDSSSRRDAARSVRAKRSAAAEV